MRAKTVCRPRPHVRYDGQVFGAQDRRRSDHNVEGSERDQQPNSGLAAASSQQHLPKSLAHFPQNFCGEELQEGRRRHAAPQGRASAFAILCWGLCRMLTRVRVGVA